MRISELERGRSGNPPARQDAIDTLPEIQLSSENDVKNQENGEMEKPKCSICLEELQDKAV